MKYKIILSLVSVLTFAFGYCNVQLQSQESERIYNILQDLKNFRYSNVFFFEVNDATIRDLNLFPLFNVKEPKKDPAVEKFMNKVDNFELMEEIKSEVEQEVNGTDDNEDADANGDKKKKKGSKIGASEFKKYYTNFLMYSQKKIAKAYIITNRFFDREPATIIALVAVPNKGNKTSVEKNLSVDNSQKQIYLSNKLISALKPDTLQGSYSNLYEYLQRTIDQNGASNITATVQGLDGDSKLLEKKYGVTLPVKEDDIQQYLRITDGQPLDYQNEHELTIGLFDLIRYRHYGKLEVAKNSDEEQLDADGEVKKVIYNQFLPLFGAEIRYGLPEINYPSLWSERMTLNVMWQSNKLGVILPTNGWSNLSTSFFNQQRRLTNAGIGLYGSFDVPIKLINQGGVFNFNASYVFGDAKPNPINTTLTFFGRTANQLTDSNSYRNYELSYLPRFHAQAHYSFAINIDRYSFFRFKLGATAYMMQRYTELAKFAGKDSKTGKDIVETKNRLIDQYSYNDLSIYNKYDGLAIAGLSGLNATETIAGLSGRIEFMTNTEEQTVPWGGALQYFDGSLSGDMWIQVPVYGFSKTTKIVPAVTDSTASADASSSTTDASTNSFALSLRAQAQFYQTIFRDPRPWELQTVVIPSLQILMNF